MDSKKKGNIINVVVIGASATALGVLIAKAVKKPSPTPTGNANLSGIVRDSAGPVSGAEVMVETLTTFTDSAGQYSLKLLSTGSHGIVIKKTGYNTFSAALTLVKGDNVENALLTPVGPTPAPKGNVPGVVKDSVSGQAIEGATVYLGSGAAYTHVQLQTTTDSMGAFAFSDVELGVYDFTVVKSGYNSLSEAVTIIEGVNQLNVQLAPVPVVTTGLIINTQNMPDIIWSGSLTDLSNGKVQTWGVQNVNQYVMLQPINGTNILFQYTIGSAYNYDESSYGPFLITIPATSGRLTWDGSALTLGGASSVNLPTTSNRQTLIGTLNSVGVGNYSMTVSQSIANGSYINAGQYYIAQAVEVFGSVSSALIGRVIMVDCYLTEVDLLGDGSVIIPAFKAYSVRAQRPYPDSAYQFSGSLSWKVIEVYYPDQTEYTYGVIQYIVSVSGNVSSFTIMILSIGWNTGSVMIQNTLKGPVSNGLANSPGIPGDTVSFSLYANPNPNAVATTAPDIDINGWVHVADCDYANYIPG